GSKITSTDSFRSCVNHYGSTSPDSQARRDAAEHGGEEVTVQIAAIPGGFVVADDGPGIPEEERDSVFEFGHSESGGSGVGLAIVEQIAAAHGWEVSLSEDWDGGARFEFLTAVDR
ncbi:MAG: sensor histidine kinase, partial [Halorientalis sp.]